MYWLTTSLFIIAIFAAWKCYRLGRENGRLKFAGFALAAGLFALTQLALLFEGVLSSAVVSLVVEWGHVLCLAVVLSALAVFVRESKPDFARYPLLYTGLPLFIVISHFLISDTYALKTWLLSMYQGGAVAVALLMYSVYTWRSDIYRRVLGATVLFTLTWITFWFLPLPEPLLAWIWQILLGASILTFVIALEQVEHAVMEGRVQTGVESAH